MRENVDQNNSEYGHFHAEVAGQEIVLWFQRQYYTNRMHLMSL